MHAAKRAFYVIFVSCGKRQAIAETILRIDNAYCERRLDQFWLLTKSPTADI
jgi:hypothetical protein